ncbi:7-cyano-7-deazaguanine synthase QueC [Altererythrobacter sp. CC-YST694]|uniref:7-cyano-7-deazaguanine synthase QueC n=1 Tax=Altererythrobacter sp. CC-YST694 TaxID=2755038 RepID=UPI001D00B862|nr:7-cyano-7-deazaguanine synthase QueC [Altererythrobacter sp. CC-YST694]MCB5423726.1 7-cyano-7-deazaguanine synthase QueC [Altererythrobacter sp. CC-YST694]
MIADEKALVLFSGGQDSATCLAWALENFSAVETVGFDYGQRHRIELECRSELLARIVEINPTWKERLGADHTLDLSVLGQISETGLTRDAEIALREDGLPNTFVPGRNLLFFTLAAALAFRRKARHMIGGMCETDYSGYPDCRDDTLKALQVTLNLGMGSRSVIHTPLMWIDKAGTWALAQDLGGDLLLDLITEHSHTCYLGERTVRHEWGYGCGTCPACELRARGYESFREGTRF